MYSVEWCNWRIVMWKTSERIGRGIFRVGPLSWNLLDDLNEGDKNHGTEESCRGWNSTKSPSACKSETLESEAAKTFVFVEFTIQKKECFVFLHEDVSSFSSPMTDYFTLYLSTFFISILQIWSNFMVTFSEKLIKKSRRKRSHSVIRILKRHKIIKVGYKVECGTYCSYHFPYIHRRPI